MAEYAYTAVTGKLKSLLDKIRSAGIPPKITNVWLKTIGFTSSNDGSLIGVLKFIGFADQGGIPTSTWSAFRGKDHKAVLAEAIRRGYSDLYAVYPDAHTKSSIELSHVFSTSSSAGAQVIAKTVATFKALVDEADFSLPSPSVNQPSLQGGPLHMAPAAGSPPLPRLPQGGGSPEVHIDIQIHISPESTAEQIEKIFQSMAKHLYGRRDG